MGENGKIDLATKLINNKAEHRLTNAKKPGPVSSGSNTTCWENNY